jgi:hypothetical protein
MYSMEKTSYSKSKYELIDIINSFAWLFMDASWLYNYPSICGTSMIILLSSGSLLCVKSISSVELYSRLALYLWMWMNSLWMLSDIYGYANLELYAKIMFPVSIVFLCISFFLPSAPHVISAKFSRFHGFLFSRKNPR